MTIDKAKLKELAEIMVRDIEGCLTNSEARDFQQHVADYEALTQPDGVLALLAEIERLRDSHEQVCTNYNRVSFASEERGKQVDQLKADNEALRKDAERYRWLRDGEYLHAWAVVHICDEPRRAELTDRTIDAAMAKEASHD